MYQELKNIIEKHNPFDRPLVVRNNDIWEKHFPDVSSINSHASDEVFKAIEEVKNGNKSVVGITITAEK
ncbi:MAG: hypothetical protein AAFQ91_13140, partial [Cyanobacteria bacterium J06621_15]